MDVKIRDDLFFTICQMSHNSVDPQVKKRIEEMVGRSNEDVKDELLGLIDDIAYYALTTGVVQTSLDIIWKQIGGSDQELAERNALLDDESNVELLKPKYKWRR